MGREKKEIGGRKKAYFFVRLAHRTPFRSAHFGDLGDTHVRRDTMRRRMRSHFPHIAQVWGLWLLGHIGMAGIIGQKTACGANLFSCLERKKTLGPDVWKWTDRSVRVDFPEDLFTLR
jgi:hypothetical protein